MQCTPNQCDSRCFLSTSVPCRKELAGVAVVVCKVFLHNSRQVFSFNKAWVAAWPFSPHAAFLISQEPISDFPLSTSYYDWSSGLLPPIHTSSSCVCPHKSFQTDWKVLALLIIVCNKIINHQHLPTLFRSTINLLRWLVTCPSGTTSE